MYTSKKWTENKIKIQKSITDREMRKELGLEYKEKQ